MDYLDYEGLQRYDELIKKEISDKVIGPSSSIDTHVVVFDGTTGKLVKDSGFTISKSVPSNAIFTDTNTWRPLGTGANDACAGNDSRLSNSRPASDVYSWAKASTKPAYTKSEVGLGNVTNDAQVKRSEMGAASGVATLDSAGKVPSSQLPSYVDDVLEYNTKPDFPTTGEAGKIYVDKSTNTTWRWSGSAYTQIKGDLAIGTTTGTAADGGVANTHYSNTSNPHSVTKAQVGLGSVVNTGDSATPVSGGTTKFTTGGAYTELNKKVDKVSGKGLSTNDYTTDEKNKLAGIAAGAEVNVQSDWNATSGDAQILNKPTIPAAAANGTYTVKTLVGSTTTNVSDFTANQSSADDVIFVQGSNVTITPDATNRKITIAAKDTTYSDATTTSAGLMSATDKTKLNGIESGAQTHKAPTAAEVKSALGTGSGTSKYLREDGTWQTPPTVTESTVSGWGFTKNTGTVTSVKVGSTSYSPSSGVISLPTYPTSLPASDVSSWAKAASKPSYGYSEIGYTINAITSAGGTLSLDGTTPLHVITLTGNVSALMLSTNPPAGHSCHVILTSTAERTVAIAHDSTNRVCPEAADVSLTVKADGYVEIDFLNANGKIYVRGV